MRPQVGMSGGKPSPRNDSVDSAMIAAATSIVAATSTGPRSSVPSGCAHEGVSMRAAKSMSLMATFQTNGPSAMARIIASRMNVLANAILWRRNRRHASSHGENCRAGRCGVITSAEGDTRVEPSIEDVRDEVEQDDEAGEHESHRHDHWGVVGENCADQQ